MKAWTKATGKAAAVLIIASVEAWRGSKDFPAPEFVPHPATWLNAERWTDELSDRKQVVTDAEREAFMAEHRRKMMEMSNERTEPVGTRGFDVYEDDGNGPKVPWL